LANLILNGSTSGSVTLSSPAVSGTTTLTLPTTSGTLAITAAPTFTGQATIPTINLTGGQIVFPATQSASADANTLDDYEEGTWTPTVFIGATGVTSYHFQYGSYTRVGRIVHANCWVRVNVKGAATGSISIRGLPFNVANSSANYTAGTIGYQDEMLSSSAPIYCYTTSNSATVNLAYVNATAVTDVTQANLNNGQFMMQVSYATST